MPDITTTQAARILDCCERTVRNLERRGALSAKRIGPNRQRIFDLAQVVALREQRAVAGDGPFDVRSVEG